MYAIVKTGGKQYKVAEGDVIEVEKLDAAPGAEVALAAVLLVDGDDRHPRRRQAGQGRRSPPRWSRRPRARRSRSTSSRTRPATTSAWVTVSS